jgi:hypothetical protein
MFEDDIDRINREVRNALRKKEINKEYTLRTERIPIHNETYETRVTGKDINLNVTTEVIPLHSPEFTLTIKGDYKGRKIKDTVRL